MNILQRLILIFGAISLLAAIPVSSQDNEFNHNSQDDFMQPYEQDTYGLGVHSDATGKPFKWITQYGETVQPGINIEPDGYGLGVGQDEYGRPVIPKKW